MTNPGQKYARQIRQTLPGEGQGKTLTVDLYDVFRSFPTTDALKHAVKKLLMPGERGHKTREKDLREAIHSIERELQSMAATPDDPPPAPNSPPFEGEVKPAASLEPTEFVEFAHIVWQIERLGNCRQYVAADDEWYAKITHNDTLCLWVAYVYWTGQARPAVDRSFPLSHVGLRDAAEWVASEVSR
jgi:hypothetical protein